MIKLEYSSFKTALSFSVVRPCEAWSISELCDIFASESICGWSMRKIPLCTIPNGTSPDLVLLLVNRRPLAGNTSITRKSQLAWISLLRLSHDELFQVTSRARSADYYKTRSLCNPGLFQTSSWGSWNDGRLRIYNSEE